METPVADDAVAAIRAGKPVILPTDTVYGLCCMPYREEPVRHLYRLKRRAESQPIALVASDIEVLFECVPELRGRAGVIARVLLPGPVTLVLPNPARRYRWLTGSSPETIGVRVPLLRGVARDVLERVGCVAATSANLAGGPESRRAEDVPAELVDGVAHVLDGGELPGRPSTVLDLTSDEPRVLREGAMPAAEALSRVEQALGARP